MPKDSDLNNTHAIGNTEPAEQNSQALSSNSSLVPQSVQSHSLQRNNSHEGTQSPSPSSNDSSVVPSGVQSPSSQGDNPDEDTQHKISPPPSYTLSPQKELYTLKLTDRYGPRVGYILQQKGVTITCSTLLSLTAAASIMHLYDPTKFDLEKFTTLISNYEKYVIVPAIALGVLGITLLWNGIKQYKNTQEYQFQKDSTAQQVNDQMLQNADRVDINTVLRVEEISDILQCIYDHQRAIQDKIIKSVSLKYNNGVITLGKYDYGAISEFNFNIAASQDNCIDLDKLKTNRISRLGSVMNNRPIRITALLTCCIITNAAVLCALYTAEYINNPASVYSLNTASMFYLSTNTGLALLTVSCIATLSIAYFGFHYYNKTSCYNMLIPRNDDLCSEINNKIISKVSEERTDALRHHYSEGKGSSLTLSQVVVEYYDGPKTINNIN